MQLLTQALTVLKMAGLKLKHRSGIQMNGPLWLAGKVSIQRQKGILKFGRGVRIFSGTHISAPLGMIEFGDNVFINRNCSIVSHCSIKIGARCIFGPNVLIYDHDHNFDYEGLQQGFKASEVIIGEKCWIGGGAIILRGSRIGDGCVIGAGTIVKGEIPPRSLVVANRTTLIKPLVRRD